jgi:anaerobic selenocysteine-containing dehydrogenase
VLADPASAVSAAASAATSAGAVRVVHTACTLDCPDACSLAVTVTDGVITDIDAAPGNPLTDGWICAKVKRHAARIYGPDRVLTPLIRTGPKGSGEFRSASWSEAVDLIRAQMKSALSGAGPDSIVPFTYNSSAGVHESSGFTEALFAALGAATVDHTICAATFGASWDSVFPGMHSADPFDVVQAKLVVVWGANPTVSNTHFPPLVHQAVKQGAKVVVIDPRRTAMAKRADLHLAVRPGTDVVLALAVANYWASHGMVDQQFVSGHAKGAEEFLAAAASSTEARSIDDSAKICGLRIADIETFAHWYGTTRPAMLRIGWGQERNANGGAACRAILALPVLAGHFGVVGSGVIGSTSSGTPKSTRRRWPAFPHPAQDRRTLAMHRLGEWLAPGAGDPCRVLFVQGANPAVMCPDTNAVHAALSRTDVFTVVHDQVLTDTARFADIVLPATTAFEIDDVAGSYGSFTIQPVRAVIDRVGESRSNDEVGLTLANALGFDWNAASIPHASCVDDEGPRVTRTQTVQFLDTEPAGGRARLVDPKHGVPAFVALEDTRYPLTLISPATAKTVSSMFGEFQSPEPRVIVHPDDAAARSIVHGGPVTVANDRGRVLMTAVVSDETCRGTVITPKGIWLRFYTGGEGINALIPMTADALAGGACFNDARVDVVAG